ncbi:MAG: hypothetical protein AAFU85_19805 [Planctomycetota bacterium]
MIGQRPANGLAHDVGARKFTLSGVNVWVAAFAGYIRKKIGLSV